MRLEDSDYGEEPARTIVCGMGKSWGEKTDREFVVLWFMGGGGWGSFGDGFCIGIGFIGMQIDFVDEDNDVALLTGGSQVLLSFV